MDKNIDNTLIKYILGSAIMLSSTIYSYSSIKKVLNINFWAYIRTRIQQKNNDI